MASDYVNDENDERPQLTARNVYSEQPLRGDTELDMHYITTILELDDNLDEEYDERLEREWAAETEEERAERLRIMTEQDKEEEKIRQAKKEDRLQ
eukprot:2144258-Amphidinium_carterae.2